MTINVTRRIGIILMTASFIVGIVFGLALHGEQAQKVIDSLLQYLLRGVSNLDGFTMATTLPWMLPRRWKLWGARAAEQMPKLFVQLCSPSTLRHDFGIIQSACEPDMAYDRRISCVQEMVKDLLLACLPRYTTDSVHRFIKEAFLKEVQSIGLDINNIKVACAWLLLRQGSHESYPKSASSDQE